ncbi:MULTISPECIES: SAM-dependent methyltransferase [unclassified Sporosarcina]|uniref:SAM-dependent methyltransferase n=1 Tax=unclassified Sporosarcina TaxID=2647733 RepID=UPI000C162EB0|nr:MULTISPECIES: SAM-dependent methyltransferase [unclassified Sporosarcina]PIC98448.1 SAM-dependent methyltransferase [Sporosarcina sp. P29]PID04951.1 SAM-dependent methyltransferase [Sporosarcina sp. P30]PID08210.1 SAM-dependent methyltransferase [Sporosarcina sp. P31]PID11290.1 SAM-dependent methyltransferase [Sporosarcina sp. P32b]
MQEQSMDKRLHIKTLGVKEWIHQSSHYNRYEATPYEMLDYLFTEHDLLKEGSLIDFGCGKGRVPFYVNHLFCLDTIGIEMNGVLHQNAMTNLMEYRQAFPKRPGSISFECCIAESYIIPADAVTFYFFNPFSLDIFRSVVQRILKSAENTPRALEIILYYPTDEYVYFMHRHPLFEKVAEIPITHLQIHDKAERFLVYTYKQP